MKKTLFMLLCLSIVVVGIFPSLSFADSFHEQITQSNDCIYVTNIWGSTMYNSVESIPATFTYARAHNGYLYRGVLSKYGHFHNGEKFIGLYRGWICNTGIQPNQVLVTDR